MKTKKYLLFAWKKEKPKGGIFDYKRSFSCIDQAYLYTKTHLKQKGFDVFQIINKDDFKEQVLIRPKNKKEEKIEKLIY